MTVPTNPIEWYLHAADRARRAVLPSSLAIALPPPPEEGLPQFLSSEEALAWSRSALTGIIEALTAALAASRADLAWRLTATIDGLVELTAPTQRCRLHQIGLTAAETAADQFGIAVTSLQFGDGAWCNGAHVEALAAYRRAITTARTIGHRWVEAFALRGTGMVYLDAGRTDLPTRRFHAALDLFRAAGDRRGEAMTMRSLASVYAEAGNTVAAREYANAAVALCGEIGDRWSQAWCRLEQARIVEQTGDQVTAAAILTQAANQFDHHGDPDRAAMARTRIPQRLAWTTSTSKPHSKSSSTDQP